MQKSETLLPEDNPLDRITLAYLSHYPESGARFVEGLTLQEAQELLVELPVKPLARLWAELNPGMATRLLESLPESYVLEALSALEPQRAALLLSRMEVDVYTLWLTKIEASLASELKELLSYPEESVGRIMQSRVQSFRIDTKIGVALQQLRAQGLDSLRHLFLMDKEQRLIGQVDLPRLLLADDDAPLSQVALPVNNVVNVLDPIEEVLERNQDWHLEVIPVIDLAGHLVGVINSQQFFETVKEDLVTDLQTMVGASRDERALSSSWFAVRKRLPWLQINLLTAFLAAAVVGMFESTIAMYTALAVLLPVAAGQSGNAGAQALAVTMRGLTLREITVSQWLRVLLKEMNTGLINGLAIALTCGVGVYLWSQSFGLSLIIAISMVISLIIAGMAGALVPILLKRFGQDPAQSSSIVLTTVTDIAGFLSFLGIATLLSPML